MLQDRHSKSGQRSCLSKVGRYVMQSSQWFYAQSMWAACFKTVCLGTIPVTFCKQRTQARMLHHACIRVHARTAAASAKPTPWCVVLLFDACRHHLHLYGGIGAGASTPASPPHACCTSAGCAAAAALCVSCWCSTCCAIQSHTGAAHVGPGTKQASKSCSYHQVSCIITCVHHCIMYALLLDPHQHLRWCGWLYSRHHQSDVALHCTAPCYS